MSEHTVYGFATGPGNVVSLQRSALEVILLETPPLLREVLL